MFFEVETYFLACKPIFGSTRVVQKELDKNLFFPTPPAVDAAADLIIYATFREGSEVVYDFAHVIFAYDNKH